MSEDDSDSNGDADETKDDNNAPMCQARPVATEVHFQHKVKKKPTTHMEYLYTVKNMNVLIFIVFSG